MASDRCIGRGVHEARIFRHGASYGRRMAQHVACEGDARLSGKQSGEAHDKGDKRSARSPKDRKLDKASVVGRALRTVYDETLREDIPDDFLDLLGKLG
jgi:hypothetical protein